MKIALLLGVSLLFSTAVYANGSSNPSSDVDVNVNNDLDIKNANTNINNLSSHSDADANSKSNSNSSALAFGGKGGDADSLSLSNATGGKSSAAVGDVTSASSAANSAETGASTSGVSLNQTYQQVHQAPGVSVIGGTNTASCLGSYSLGVSVVGGGGGFGVPHRDRECDRREMAQFSMQYGDPKTAWALMCQNKDFRKARATIGQPCE